MQVLQLKRSQSRLAMSDGDGENGSVFGGCRALREHQSASFDVRAGGPAVKEGLLAVSQDGMPTQCLHPPCPFVNLGHARHPAVPAPSPA